MQRKYCVVAMRGDLGNFREMLDLASSPGEKIGAMNSPTVMVATFISSFNMIELEKIFKSVEEVNFFLMEIETSVVHIDNKDLYDTLMSIFSNFDKYSNKKHSPLSIRVMKKTQEEIERDFSSVYDEVEKEYSDQIKNMSPKEKKEILDEILDRMPDISSRDRVLLSMISRYL